MDLGSLFNCLNCDNVESKQFDVLESFIIENNQVRSGRIQCIECNTVMVWIDGIKHWGSTN